MPDQLLKVPHEARMLDMEKWRKGPVPQALGPTMVKALDQVTEVMGTAKLGAEALVPPRPLAELARYGMSATPRRSVAAVTAARLATLLATGGIHGSPVPVR